jgi:hypothetical protein
MSLQLNISKIMLTSKVDKIGFSGRSNQSFWFPHVKPMIQLLGGTEIQSSRTHLQRPSYVVRIGERGKSIQPRRFHLLDIQCPNPGGASPMMVYPYAPWFGWYAPPMQYESFYPRSAKHEPNAFDSSAHPRKDRFYSKSRLNAAKTQE